MGQRIYNLSLDYKCKILGNSWWDQASLCCHCGETVVNILFQPGDI
jgi:hypothetical protein